MRSQLSLMLLLCAGCVLSACSDTTGAGPSGAEPFGSAEDPGAEPTPECVALCVDAVDPAVREACASLDQDGDLCELEACEVPADDQTETLCTALTLNAWVPEAPDPAYDDESDFDVDEPDYAAGDDPEPGPLDPGDLLGGEIACSGDLIQSLICYSLAVVQTVPMAVLSGAGPGELLPMLTDALGAGGAGQFLGLIQSLAQNPLFGTLLSILSIASPEAASVIQVIMSILGL